MPRVHDTEFDDEDNIEDDDEFGSDVDFDDPDDPDELDDLDFEDEDEDEADRD